MHEKKSYLRKFSTLLFFVLKIFMVGISILIQNCSYSHFSFTFYQSFMIKSISFIKKVKLLYCKRFLLFCLRLERRKLVKFAVRTIRLWCSSLGAMNHIKFMYLVVVVCLYWWCSTLFVYLISTAHDLKVNCKLKSSIIHAIHTLIQHTFDPTNGIIVDHFKGLTIDELFYSMVIPTQEWYSTTRLLFFYGINFSYRRSCMEFYLMTQFSIKEGFQFPFDGEEKQLESNRWSMGGKSKGQVNSKAIVTLQCGLASEQLTKVNLFNSVKEMWEKLI